VEAHLLNGASMTGKCNDGMLYRVESENLPANPTLRKQELESWLRPCLFALSFIACMSLTGAGAYWIDSGELAAAGATLGIAHPPGHPLFALLSYIASLIPIGPIGFRIALLSGVCAAWSVVLVYDIIRLATHDTQPSRLNYAFAILSSVIFATCGGLVLQAVRAEVYTLNLVLLLAALKLALTWKINIEEAPAFLALQIAFLLGLALSNHHLLVVAFLPSMLVWLLHVPEGRVMVRKHGVALCLFGLSGLLLYVYLPLRSYTDPLVNFGDPRTFERFLDVLVAKSFQPSIGADDIDVGANVVAALSMFEDSLGTAVLLTSVIGMLVLCRSQKWLALTLLLAITGNLATKLTMVLDPNNPDAAGYFLLTMALLTILTGIAMIRVNELGRAGARIASVGLACALLFVATSTSARHLSQHGTSQIRSPAVVDAWMVKDMPPGSILMPIHPHLYFNRLYHASIDAYRPDLLIVHQSLDRRIANGAPYAEFMGRRDPDLQPLLKAGLETEGFPFNEVIALSKKRGIYIEAHNRLEGDVDLDLMGKSGLYSSVHSASHDAATQEHGVRFDELTTLMNSPAGLNSDERRMLGYLAASATILRCKQGFGKPANDAFQALQRIFPDQAFDKLMVHWGPYSRSLRDIVDALMESEQSGRLQRLERVRLFARHGDYSSLLPQ
jgi:hypothetical protein